MAKDAEQEAELDAKKRKVEELRNKLNEISGQKVSVNSTIQYIDTKINLSQAEIDTTQSEINQLETIITDLEQRISGLELSLDQLSTMLVARINAAYKYKQSNPIHLLLFSQGITDFLKKYRYMQTSQAHTREIMQQVESQKLTFNQQKQEKQQRQAEVEQKRVVLEQQQLTLETEKQDQKVLLTELKHDEVKYQNELKKTLAEIEAIQSIIAGKGEETKVEKVKEGDVIASIIAGPSACSTGAHLHFEIAKNGAHKNPAEYLKNESIDWDNSPDGTFGFSGNWRWPVVNPARITQGYGMTYYARVKRFYGGQPHTGIDMLAKNNSSWNIRAVKDGTLYRGGIACGGGTLRYVKVDHGDGLITYYLHVNY